MRAKRRKTRLFVTFATCLLTIVWGLSVFVECGIWFEITPDAEAYFIGVDRSSLLLRREDATLDDDDLGFEIRKNLATWGEMAERLLPIWEPGFDYFYGSIPLWPFVLVSAATTGFLWFKSLRRDMRGKCETCDYDLTGNQSGICPECGTPINKSEPKVV